MDVARWRRVESLFHRCADADAAERTRLLRAAEAEDPALRRQVEAMLDAPSLGISGLEAGLPEPSTPSRLGPWRLVREIGRGGGGVVYEAERDEGYRARAAVKLVRVGGGLGDILARLRQERQILAGLDHPHIARLLDGGSAPDGRPYLVMELVDGEPIDRWCATRALGIDERLRLVAKICSAVHAAHRRLIVHRDLKPGNILVTRDGAPKLLDFGIAKLLRRDPEPAGERSTGTEGRPETVAGLRLLTPGYASPEQIRGEPLGTATDVYSLGVVLHQLLTGALPHAPGAGLPALEHAICAEPPRAPSQALRAETVRAAGLPPVPQLARRLRGDLDAIVLQALHEEPERRYASAEQLADDLRRHLESRPIRARRESVASRALKAVRRHRAATVAAGVVLVVLLAASLITFRQARIADAERIRAQRVADLLVDVFRVADPQIEPGAPPSAREILERGAQRVVEGLEEQPLLRADLLQLLGRVHHNLGDYRRAEELHAAALAERRRLLGDHPRTAEAQNALGESLFAQGRYEAAEREVRAALESRRAAGGSELAESLNNLGALRFARDDLAEAEALFRRAVEAWSEAQDPELAQGLDNLAAVVARRGRLDEAEALLRRSLALRRARRGSGEAQPGGPHPEVARAAANLAGVLHAAGAVEEAEPLYLEALVAQEEALGDDHPQVAITLTNLGVLARESGQIERAEARLRRAAEIQRRRLGAGHPQRAVTLLHLAALPSVREERRALAREALAILEGDDSASNESLRAEAERLLGTVPTPDGAPSGAGPTGGRRRSEGIGSQGPPPAGARRTRNAPSVQGSGATVRIASEASTLAPKGSTEAASSRARSLVTAHGSTIGLSPTRSSRIWWMTVPRPGQIPPPSPPPLPG